MARPTSFGKRENEKKKASKRQEKQKRKEERRATGPAGSLEDMMAWVDENGNITDAPPVDAAKPVDASLIAVSVPRREATEPELLRGRVDMYISEKGYGFIRSEDGERYFFHVTAAPEGIAQGDAVTFETENGPRGPVAVRIQK